MRAAYTYGCGRDLRDTTRFPRSAPPAISLARQLPTARGLARRTRRGRRGLRSAADAGQNVMRSLNPWPRRSGGVVEIQQRAPSPNAVRLGALYRPTVRPNLPVRRPANGQLESASFARSQLRMAGSPRQPVRSSKRRAWRRRRGSRPSHGGKGGLGSGTVLPGRISCRPAAQRGGDRLTSSPAAVQIPICRVGARPCPGPKAGVIRRCRARAAEPPSRLLKRACRPSKESSGARIRAARLQTWVTSGRRHLQAGRGSCWGSGAVRQPHDARTQGGESVDDVGRVGEAEPAVSREVDAPERRPIARR